MAVFALRKLRPRGAGGLKRAKEASHRTIRCAAERGATGRSATRSTSISARTSLAMFRRGRGLRRCAGRPGDQGKAAALPYRTLRAGRESEGRFLPVGTTRPCHTASGVRGARRASPPATAPAASIWDWARTDPQSVLAVCNCPKEFQKGPSRQGKTNGLRYTT